MRRMMKEGDYDNGGKEKEKKMKEIKEMKK